MYILLILIKMFISEQHVLLYYLQASKANMTSNCTKDNKKYIQQRN